MGDCHASVETIYKDEMNAGRAYRLAIKKRPRVKKEMWPARYSFGGGQDGQFLWGLQHPTDPRVLWDTADRMTHHKKGRVGREISVTIPNGFTAARRERIVEEVGRYLTGLDFVCSTFLYDSIALNPYFKIMFTSSLFASDTADRGLERCWKESTFMKNLLPVIESVFNDAFKKAYAAARVKATYLSGLHSIRFVIDDEIRPRETTRKLFNTTGVESLAAISTGGALPENGSAV